VTVSVVACAKPGALSSAPASPAAANVPLRALVSDAGKPGAPPLEASQQAEIKNAASRLAPRIRQRLRYAIAPDEAGKMRFIVYDGQGLPADGKRPGKKFNYTVFRLLNVTDGSTYDPQQNIVQAPVPPPKERDTTGIGN